MAKVNESILGLPTVEQILGDDRSTFIPHIYQDRVITAKHDENKAALFLDMGTGKTSISLAMLNRNRDRLPALIIAPLRVIYTVWGQEIKKWNFPFSYKIIHGTDPVKEKALRTRADIHAINYENIPWLYGYLHSAKFIPYKSIIIDESVKLKNPEGVWFGALSKLTKHIPYRSILTGTPMPRGIEDIWSQIYLLDEGASLYPELAMFEAMWFTKDPWGKLQPKAGAKEEIEKRIEHLVCRIDARDVLRMPELTHNHISVSLPDIALERMEQVLLGFLDRESCPFAFEQFDDFNDDAELGPDELEIKSIYAALRTIASGFQYHPVIDPLTEKRIGRTVERLHTAKIDLIRDLLDSLEGENVLVAYNFKEERNLLVEAFGCPFIDGDTPGDRADQHIIDWQAGRLPILAVHPMSVAEGLNLQAGGRHVLWVSPPDNLNSYQQLNARLYRQGQERPVIIHTLICSGTVEDKIRGVLAQRGASQEQFLDSIKAYYQSRVGVDRIR